MRRITPLECLDRWKTITERPILYSTNSINTYSFQNEGNRNDNYNSHRKLLSNQMHGDDDTQQENIDSIFSCKDLVIPPTIQLVSNILKDKIEKWRELDSRVVIDDDDKYRCHLNARKRIKEQNQNARSDHDKGHEDSSENDSNYNDDDDDDDDESNYSRDLVKGDYAGINWGFHANRVRLPDFFDISSQNGPPNIPSSSSSTNQENTTVNGGSQSNLRKRKRRQVVALHDPSILLDYETELWHLFNSVPVESTIERDATEGSICKQTLQLREEFTKGLKEYSRIDAHALGRLRKRDRHSWPRLLPKNTKPTSCASIRKENRKVMAKRQISSYYPIDEAIIRIEVWRKQLLRGSGVDCNRCELEFLGSQSLLDVHNTLVNCSGDTLFSFAEINSDKLNQNNGIDNSVTEIENQNKSSSGLFFIEDTFYICGDVDYATPILKWLSSPVDPSSSKQVHKNLTKREFLGIDKDIELKVMQMKEAKLDQISMRLNVRYVHIFHGDVESAFFFSDVGTRLHGECLPKSQYPLVHDVYTTPSPSPFYKNDTSCSGCGRLPPSVVTIEDEMTNGGPTLLCAMCYAKIHYDKDGSLKYNNFRAVPLSVLQILQEISTGHETNTASF